MGYDSSLFQEKIKVAMFAKICQFLLGFFVLFFSPQDLVGIYLWV